MQAQESALTDKLELLKGSVKSDRPWIFGLLIAPTAVVANGVIQGGALSFFLRQQGADIARISSLVFLLALPTSIYFLWSPITDFLVRRRTWVLIGSLSAGIFMALAFSSKRLDSNRAIVLIFVSACMVQLVVSGCGGMMGALRDERSRRISGSFYQAGGLAFGAAAVSVLIWVYSSGHPNLLAPTAAILIAAPGLFAVAAPKQAHLASDNFSKTMQQLWNEFKATFWRWDAIPYTLTLLFPMGSGAAVGLLPGVAQDYHVSGNQVAWINGFAGAALTAGGSLAASLIPSNRRAAVVYLMLGLVNAAALCVLWLGPLRAGTYFLGVILYLFTVGACYALFTAVVLEFLGSSGKSGSGRYSLINSLGNVPVLYMIKMDGMGASKWGPRWLSGTEALLAATGSVVLLTYFLTRKSQKSMGEEQTEVAVG